MKKRRILSAAASILLVAAMSVSAFAANFSDVPDGMWFSEPVAWAFTNNITKGIGDGKFGTDDPCTRAQAVTFLHRFAGAGDGAKDSKYADVDPGEWHAVAINWAERAAITNGIGGGLFGTNEPCTRAQIATFIYRYDQSITHTPYDGPAANFSDTDPKEWYGTAVAWAAANGVTEGTGGNRFEPDLECTRSQIVTMLFRYNNLLKTRETGHAHSWATVEATGHYEKKQTGTQKVQTGTVHHDAVTHEEPIGGYNYECLKCHQTFATVDEVADHAVLVCEANYKCNEWVDGYKTVVDREAYDEPVYEDQPVYTEVWVEDTPSYQKCSVCGATK